MYSKLNLQKKFCRNRNRQANCTNHYRNAKKLQQPRHLKTTKVGVLTLPYFKTQCKARYIKRVLNWFKNKEISGL